MVTAKGADGSEFLIRKQTFIKKNTQSVDDVYIRDKKVSISISLSYNARFIFFAASDICVEF